MARNRTSIDTSLPDLTAGGAILARLQEIGIKHVFVNSGTDFPPIIEGAAAAAAHGQELPSIVVAPHEHVAMGMAYGYHKMSGRTPVAMLHTNVGLANAATGIINAACENIPLVVMSGRTPATERGRFGARTVPIGWGQEMRDQAALVRESCKWDYELRYPEQICELVDRAYAIANSTPRGPVYLALPREALCEPVARDELGAKLRFAPATASPVPSELRLAAHWIVAADNPLVIAQRGAGSNRGFRTLEKMVEDWAIPVCSWWATALPLSTEHMCYCGSNPSPLLERADLVIVLNSLAPWCPDEHGVHSEARFIHIGPDPIFARFPVRNFRADLALVGETEDILAKLESELAAVGNWDTALVEERRQAVGSLADRIRRRRRAGAEIGLSGRLTKRGVSLALGKALKGMKSTVFSELGVELDVLGRREHNSWFQEPHAGGLGWSFPAALGARLADPKRLYVAAMGDGSYMFSNPVAAHQVSEACGIPLLVVVLNNREWGAVRKSVRELYPDGYAARANSMPMTGLEPSPDFSAIARACGARAFKVKEAEHLEETLTAAVEWVVKSGSQTFVEVIVDRD
ncbi:MAG: thiamine pyrophosphate-requiring protein [Rhodobacteraceae bacterium]|nr:thiamine pyrophosphate-requiring protein [Paracoccaceae bacterium]